MIAHIDPNNMQNEQTVIKHLKGTARVAKSLGIPLDIGCLAYITGLYHDLGKFRKEFENYIRSAVSGSIKKGSTTVNHSSAGAIYIYQRYYKGSPTEKLTAQLICEAILSHHGLNDCMSVKGEDCFRKRVENLEDLDYEEVIDNLQSSEVCQDDTDEIFKKAVEEVSVLEISVLKYALSKEFTKGLLYRMLLSILIDADRLDTAVFCGDRNPEDLNAGVETDWEVPALNLEKELNNFPKKDGISALRRKIADECLAFADNPSGIYRLAVPTGGAKTLSSMRYAINHARKYKKKHIFYIGPYLSILEQNSQVFRDALGEESMILEHHSNVIMEDEKEESYGSSYHHLTENWDSPIVITTFVQFLNTLFAGKTSSVRRFHNLTDSVILIDEIQSLPITMLRMFNLTMNYLSHLCHTTVLLCSATQPVLDQIPAPIHLSEPPDLISDVDALYKQLKRVRIEEKSGIMSTDRLCGFVKEQLVNHRDMLVILNTKKAVESLYRELKSALEESGDPITLVHLSTSMCPEHRLSSINQIKNRKQGKRLVCISTSLIEAGVDLSFSSVIRSYAGLDSIAQAAGRCNRNGEEGEGVVFLVRYEAERLGHMEQIRKGAACCQGIVERFQQDGDQFYNDLLSRPALQAYYQNYYYDPDQQMEMTYPMKKDNTNMVDLLSGNRMGKKAYGEKYDKAKNPDLSMYQAFKTAGEAFEVIERNTVGILVPYGEGKNIINQLNGELPGKDLVLLMRKGQRFTVNFYRDKIQELTRAGAIASLKNGKILALKDGFYDQALGVVLDGKEEFLLV